MHIIVSSCFFPHLSPRTLQAQTRYVPSLRQLTKVLPDLPVSKWPEDSLANKRLAFLWRGFSVSQLNVSSKLLISSSNKFECNFLNSCLFPKVCLQKYSGFCYRHRVKDSVLQNLALSTLCLHIIFLSLVVNGQTFNPESSSCLGKDSMNGSFCSLGLCWAQQHAFPRAETK